MVGKRLAISAFAFWLSVLPADSARAQAVCGDSLRSGSEQCDDGNTSNLDACDSSCRFEQTHRINELKLQFNTSLDCVSNALGGAISGGTARTGLQAALDSGVGDGSTSLLLRMLGLEDLGGTNDASIQIGLLNASPIVPGATTYDGHNDLDWWYSPRLAEVDAQGIPTALLAGSATDGVLNAGPGSAILRLGLGSGVTPWSLSSMRFIVTRGASSTPSISTGVSPGHLASENLDPSLQSFATAGQPVGTAGGSLCANVSAESLRQTPVPAAFLGCGVNSCTQCYTAANSLLDVVVGGCSIFGQQISPTQPDTSDPSAPTVGNGPPYTLFANAQRVVTTCRSANAVVPLAPCLLSAAYSGFYKFSTNRVIARAAPALIFRNGFEG